MGSTAGAVRKSRRRWPTTARVVLVTLGISVCVWAHIVWRAWQAHELMAVCDSPPNAVSYGPRWFRAAGGDEVLTWLFGRPEWLEFANFDVDQTWFRRLAAVPDLSVLIVNESSFGDQSLQYVAPLRHLTKLDLVVCPNVTDAGLPRLSGLEKLHSLSLCRASVTDAGMRALVPLHALQNLDVTETPVGDAGLVHILQLQNLGSLQLGAPRNSPSAGRITDRGLALVAKLPNLQDLSLEGVALSATAVATLRSMPALKSLSLADSQMDAAALHRLAGIEVVANLSLNDCPLGDEIVDDLLSLPSLEHLHLAGTQITDAGLARLASHAKAWDLDFSRTAVSVAGLRAFRGNSRIQHLSIGDTAVGDEVVDELLQMPNLFSAGLAGTHITDAGLARLATHPRLAYLTLSRTRVTARGVQALVDGLSQINMLRLDETSIGDDDLDIFGRIGTRGINAVLTFRKTNVTAAAAARLRQKYGVRRIEWEPPAQ